MKKNVLALSITAAVVGFGFAGGAQAMTGALGGATAASSLALNGDGVGQMLLVPYFTAQDKNATLINIVNTDVVNGKAVKVRFRGAANSDDIYDFQVFLSPGDVWTANVSKGADGRAQLTTADASCTKPAKAVLNATPFVTGRLDSTLTADQKANGTREGYVEIFNMGDIPKAKWADAASYIAGTSAGQATGGTGTNKDDNALYTAIKHVNKVAPCSGDAWTYLDTTDLTYKNDNSTKTSSYAGLTAPSTGLMANWTIINVVGAAAWSGEAVAIKAIVTASGAPAVGNVVYWPQTGDPVGVANIDAFTADPLLRSADVKSAVGTTYTAQATPAVTAGFYDLPDLSTPYTAAAINPLQQAKSVTGAIASTSTTNEFLTDTAIVASTDWVFSMPTRRYSVAFNYGATLSATDDGRRFSDILETSGAYTTGYFLASNTVVSSATNGNGRQVCVKGITTTPYDREETGVASVTTVVVSPSTPADPMSFCGEAAVLSINNGGIQTAGTGALKASVAVKDLDVTFRDGWMKITTPEAAITAAKDNLGLPLIGASFARAWAGTQSFGVTSAHRMTRAVK